MFCTHFSPSVEASDPISDQSMQYNDLYVHRDPRQSKCMNIISLIHKAVNDIHYPNICM